MTNQQGAPEALRLALSIDLMDTFTDYQQEELNKAAAELRRQHDRIAELEAELAGGVQALSAAPEAFLKSVIALCSHRGYSPANIETWDKDDKWIADLWRQAEAMLAASPTPPAEKQAQPGAVYAELPEPTTHQIAELKACEHGDAIVGWRVEPSRQSFHASMHPKRTLYTTEQARNFADRTHALRVAAAPQAAPAQDKCAHRIADARNSVVQSGYLCIDCGEVFKAASHTTPQTCFDAADMATASAQGFRDGVASLSANAGEPTEDVKQKIASNTWDHFGDILPTLKAISRGEWYWGANSRCKYIEIRLDTRDGGCLLFDQDRVRISPEQFAHQHHRVKMEPWPAQNSLAAAPQPAAPAGWRELAARVMDALADAQDKTNSEYPEHVKCYPSWASHARWLRWHADMFRTGKPVGNGAGQPGVLAALAASPTPPAEQKAQPCADMRRLHDLLYAAQRQTTFDAAHGAITAARIELSNLMAASPTTVKQQAAPKAAPAKAADSAPEDAGGANWQDISTAPKDGTRFVAVGNNYGLYSETQHVCIAQWFRGCWMEASDWNETSELKYLTHWMPLPPLPGNAARKQGGA